MTACFRPLLRVILLEVFFPAKHLCLTQSSGYPAGVSKHRKEAGYRHSYWMLPVTWPQKKFLEFPYTSPLQLLDVGLTVVELSVFVAVFLAHSDILIFSLLASLFSLLKKQMLFKNLFNAKKVSIIFRTI